MDAKITHDPAHVDMTMRLADGTAARVFASGGTMRLTLTNDQGMVTGQVSGANASTLITALRTGSEVVA